MSSLQYFTREVKVLPGVEETGISKKLTEANKNVAEMLEQQQQPESTHKWKPTVYSSESCEDLKVRFCQRHDYGFYLIILQALITTSND